MKERWLRVLGLQASISAIVAIFLGCIIGAGAVYASPPQIGINLTPIEDYGAEILFADAVKESRGFGSGVAVDSNGWPLENATLGLWYGAQPGTRSGTYGLSFNGEATVTPNAGSVSNQVYTSSTNTTTATVTVPSGTEGGYQIVFTNTQRTSGSATNTGLTNIKFMRPTTEGGSTPLATTVTFTPQYETFLEDFSVVRFMQYLDAYENITEVNWSDRWPPTQASQQTGGDAGNAQNGAAIEYAVQLCNEINRDMWINIPLQASNSYISNEALLVKYGSNGTLPYTSTQSNPVFPPLNSNLHCYVEYSNEIWNGGAPVYQQNVTDGLNEQSSYGGSLGPLDWDGNTTLTQVRHWAERTVQISNIFRNIFGNGAMPGTSANPQIRPVMETQNGWPDNWTLVQFQYMESYFNNQLALNAMPDGPITTAEPPSYYLYGGGGAPYYSYASGGDDNLNDIWTSGDFLPANFITDMSTPEVVYYLPLLGRRCEYEGGPQLSNSDTVDEAAWSDSRMTTAVVQNQTAFNQTGGTTDLWAYFDAQDWGSPSVSWAFMNDCYDLNTPKMNAVTDIDSSTQSVGTYGAPITGGATIAASTFCKPPSWGVGSINAAVNTSTEDDWYCYVVNCTAASAFNIALSAGSSGTGNSADIYVDGALVGNVAISNTGSDTTYANTSTVATPTLAAGAHGVLVKVHSGSLGLNSLIFTTASGSAPAAPTGLSASAGNTQVSLTWNSSTGATSYNVYRGTTSGGESGTAIATGITSNSYINTGLTNGVTYYYEVKALNSYGTSGYSNEASATPMAAPAAPTGLTATPGIGQIALSWTASTGATSYNVLRSTASGGETQLASGVSATSYTDTAVLAGTTYYYEVTAVNSAGTSSASSQASAAPQAATLPIQINCGGPAVSPFVADTDFSGGLTATNYTGAITTTGLTNPAPQAVYQSERYASPAMTYTIPGLVPGTTYTVRLHMCENYYTASGGRVFDVFINGTEVLTNFDIYATTGAEYKATIQQFNEPANSSGQFVLTFTNVTNYALLDGVEVVSAGVSPPAAPTGLTASPGNAQVALSWSASTGATSYNVLRSTTSGSGYAQVVNVTTTSYTNTGLTNGTTYYYVVAAVNSGGTSANSGQASATPVAPPAAPTGLTATPGNGQVGLSWSASPGATSYNVLRSTVSGSGYAQVTNVTTTSYTNTGLTNGTTYYFVVAAVNAGGTSANSSQASAVPQVPAPAAPTGLTAVAGNAQVTLSWTASSGATSYNVYRGTTSGGESATAIATGVTTTGYANTGLTNGTTYYYKVTALNAGGTSGYSNEASATPSSGLTLPFQVNCGGPAVSPFIADTDFSGGTPYTNWTGAITTTGLTNPAPQAVYQSERYGALTYTIPGLTSGTTYTVRLHLCENYNSTVGYRLINYTINGTQVLSSFDIFKTAGGEHIGVIEPFNIAANSNGQVVITDAVASGSTDPNPLINGIEILTGSSAPAAPTNLTATAGAGQVGLSWTGSTGATSYDVYLGTTSGGEGATPIATGITSTAYTNTGLLASTTYYYKVTGVNSAGTSGYSNEASATTPLTPTQLTATPGNTIAALGWTASTGSTSYNIYRGTTAGGESATAIATGVTTTWYTNTGLTNGVTYYYEVKGVSSTSTTGYSNETSAVPTTATAQVAFATTTPVINGSSSSAWSGATSYNLTNLIGAIPSGQSNSASYQAMWDSTNLYLLVQVTDSTLIENTTPYNGDAVEVYVDGTNGKATSYSATDWQYVFQWDNSTVYEYQTGAQGTHTAGVKLAQSNTSGGYIIEVAIPWSTIGVSSPAANSLIGLDVANDNSDVLGTRCDKLHWWAQADNDWTDPTFFGTATLL